MPQLVAFKRRWAIGSDDFVYPGLGEIFLRIIWIVAVSAVFHLHKDAFECDGGYMLQAYYIGLLSLLAINLVMTAVIVYISTRGTITNCSPRRGIAKLIYIKFATSFPELVWNTMGTYWAFGKSSGCEWHVVTTVKGVVLSGWVIALLVIIGIAIVFDPLGTLHDRGNLQTRRAGDADQAVAHAAISAKKIWEARCTILCCCVGCDERSTDAYNEIADLFSTFFKGVDLVPTDIACGFILLHREQQEQKYALSSVTVEPSQDENYTQRSPAAGTSTSIRDQPTQSELPHHKPWMTVDMMCHYMKFAMASYGWPLYMFTHLMTGICQLSSQCKCCSCLTSKSDINDDNCCQCNTSAIKKSIGVHPDDIVYISFHNKIYETPFFVSIDTQHQAVVVAIRGTLSLKDAITDMTAECDTIQIEGLENCQAHKGMLISANYVKSTLERLNILEQAFDRAQGAKLVITGHSLGAGTAALLALLLKPKYPDLICFAFSPPGGLLSLPASEYCNEFICSVVLGKDLIPRLGIHTMEDLKVRLLKSIQNCDQPKYQLLASGVLQLFCGWKPPSKEEVDQSRLRHPLLEEGERQTSANYSGDHSNTNIESALHAAQHQNEQCRILHTNMYPPGQIMQITESQSKQSCCGVPDYFATWKTQRDYSQVIISPKMLSDHLPDAVMRALNQLKEKNYTPTSHQPGSVISI